MIYGARVRQARELRAVPAAGSQNVHPSTNRRQRRYIPCRPAPLSQQRRSWCPAAQGRNSAPIGGRGRMRLGARLSIDALMKETDRAAESWVTRLYGAAAE